MPMDNTLAAAKAIAAARRNRTPLNSLGAGIAPQDEAEGYRIQRTVHDLLLPYFGTMVGYKIGCTSSVMQRYLDIPHPCVFAKGVHDSGASLRASDFVRVGVECEIAVKLSRDLPASAAPFTAHSVAQAIEAYLPAIEIVDDRYVQWETMGSPTLVADDFFAAGCVLGAPVARTAAPDLLDVIGRAIINGAEVGRGTGADVLGHPHNALAWLANHLATSGKALRAGQIVLTGSLVKTVWLNAGQRDDGIVGAGDGASYVRLRLAHHTRHCFVAMLPCANASRLSQAMTALISNAPARSFRPSLLSKGD
jgi:2-keto-4-pentenoate hydratase